MEYYIAENFYFDIDTRNQFRVAGPGNHLFLGFSVNNLEPFGIEKYKVRDNQLTITLKFETDCVEISQPLVCDIRTLRSHTEGKRNRNTYGELASQGKTELLPQYVENNDLAEKRELSFRREFYDESGVVQEYGARVVTSSSVEIDQNSEVIKFKGKKPVRLEISTISNIPLESSLSAPVFSEDQPLQELNSLPSIIQDLYHESGKHIAHLVRARKTSSFEYGTIFPRDWIESAQLGVQDLSQEAIDYMFEQSLKHVDEQGQGWHEDLVGEYRYKSSKELLVDRKMIDIEPLYLLGIELVSKQFLLNQDNVSKLRVVGKYVFNQAKKHSLITFKKKLKSNLDEYYEVGNWRDSIAAFPNHTQPIAPYDVNCVFYPEALRIIRKYCELFDLMKSSEQQELDELIHIWSRKKKKFLVRFANNMRGYCLALHGEPAKPLSLAHLDESYDLFYGEPSLEDIMSFADRVLSDEYFYTPVGPLLVASTTQLLSEKNYHGKVIWPKQAAFVVAGLAREYRYGLQSGWPKLVLDQLYEAIIKTAEACFKGWEDLGTVTELYYYDKEKNTARFYLDQEDVEGQMSLIQLWSAVGCRRIIREYVSVRELGR